MSTLGGIRSVAIFALAAGAVLVAACGSPVLAQPGGSTTNAELQPLYAVPEDIAEGNSLSESACAGCHGEKGVSKNPLVPNLAGQRAPYLYLGMKDYQAGARSDAAMNDPVKFLSDDALVKLAAYFASLDPPQQVANKTSDVNRDPLQAGKAATGMCAGCHGESGVSKVPGTPSLVGLDPAYLTAAMTAYKSGQRKNETMKSMVAAATDADMSNIALFYALQAAAPAKNPVSGDAAAGKTAAASCAGCHGDTGVSANPATPSLAGQDAQYIVAALRAYKNGTRSDETMKGMAAAFDDAAMNNLSAFYAAQQPQRPNVRKPLTTAEWAQRCDRCHGINGNSSDPRLPALAGQRADYLEKALRDYRSGNRKSPQMAAMSGVLSDQDIKDLSAHYASRTARAAVFVPMPSK
jgi:cytochrome c553